MFTLIFVLGLCIGSFLNAFLYRYEKKKSITGRSFCPTCKKELNWYDMVPVFSYFFLGRRCRFCRSQISFQYPLVELTTGLLFLSFFLKLKTSSNILDHLLNGELLLLILGTASALMLFVIAAILILISVYDIKKKEIPNGFNLSFVIASLIYSTLVLPGRSGGSLFSLLIYVLAGALAFLFFYAFVYVSKETWMGGGDAKLAFGIGLFLGPASTFVAILLSTWIAAIFGIFLMANGKAKAKTEIPFGPFLALGTVISFLFGSQIINTYAKIFLGF